MSASDFPFISLSLSGIASLGLTVVITDDALPPAPTALDPQDLDEGAIAQIYRWHPEKSPTGPLSIVLNGSPYSLPIINSASRIKSERRAFGI